MKIFVILNIIKFILGSGIIYLAYNYIDLNKDFFTGILVMGLGIFIVLWSLSFFLLLFIFFIVYGKKTKFVITKAYKYTGLFASYVLMNFMLLAFDFWTKSIGIILFICFVLLGLII